MDRNFIFYFILNINIIIDFCFPFFLVFLNHTTAQWRVFFVYRIAMRVRKLGANRRDSAFVYHGSILQPLFTYLENPEPDIRVDLRRCRHASFYGDHRQKKTPRLSALRKFPLIYSRLTNSSFSIDVKVQRIHIHLCHRFAIG